MTPSPQPFSFAISGQTDANGNALLQVTGLQAGVPGAFNLALNVQGNAPSITILQGGIQLSSGSAINGDAQLGPIIWDGSSSLQVAIAGALGNTPVTGFVTGIQSFDPQDLAAITGTTTQTVGTVTAYDGQTLISENSQIHTQDETYPLGGGVFDVRLWASVLLGLRFSVGTPDLLITFRWFANPDGTRLVGQRSMMLNIDVPTLVATIPNLGPYLQVVVNRIPASSSWTWNASLLTSQRIVNDVFGGNFNPYLLEAYGTSQGASTTTTTPFGTVYGGPVWFAVFNENSSPASIGFRLFALGSDGTYHSIAYRASAVAANTDVAQSVILPPVPCQLQVVAGATAGTYTWDAVIYSSATASS